MIPPPLTSSALTRSDAQYSIHAATSSVRGSRSLKLSCPQRRMVAYHDGAGAATGRRGPAWAVAPAAAARARNSRRSMGSTLYRGSRHHHLTRHFPARPSYVRVPSIPRRLHEPGAAAPAGGGGFVHGVARLGSGDNPRPKESAGLQPHRNEREGRHALGGAS